MVVYSAASIPTYPMFLGWQLGCVGGRPTPESVDSRFGTDGPTTAKSRFQ